MQPFRIITQGSALIVLLVAVSSATAAEFPSDITPYNRGQPGDLIPRPDPSALTTAQLLREIENLRAIINTRLEASDKAIALLREQSDKIPAVTETKIGALQALLSERFKGMEIQFDGIQLQFKERDVRVEQSSKSTETAINAALQAQKESVLQQNTSFAEATRKAEVATKERLDQLTALFQTETKALASQLTAISKSLDDKIVVIDRRVGLMEGSGVGQNAARGEQNMSSTLLISVMGIVVSIIAVGVALVMAFKHKEQEQGGRREA